MSSQGKSAASGNSNALFADRSQDQAQPDQSVPGFPVYDFYDKERAEILAQLHERLGKQWVPASFWALLQVCDIEKLKDLVKGAEFVPDLIMAWACTCSVIPKKWNQKHKDSSGNSTPSLSPVHKKRKRTSETYGSSPTSPGPSSPLPGDEIGRDPRAILLAKQRDHFKCILTGDDKAVQGAHIFPYSLLNTRSPTSDIAKATPNLWRMLRVFWSDSTVDNWKNRIFSGANGKAIDGPFNIISLSSTYHAHWTAAVFGLRYIKHDKDSVTVEFCRLPEVNHKHHDLVELIQPPSKTAKTILRVPKVEKPGDPSQNIENGDQITIRTEDPEQWPVPHPELLDMHWKLNAVVALSAAAEPQDLDYFSDDDDNCDVMSDVLWRRGFVTSPYEPTSQPTSPPRSSPKKAQATNTETEVEMEAEAEGLEEDLDSDEHSRGCI